MNDMYIGVTYGRQTNTSDIQVTYEYIRMTSTYECYMDDIQAKNASDILVT